MLNKHHSQHLIPLIGVFALFALFFGWLPLARATIDCTVVTEIPAVECQVLVELYDSTDGSNWFENWNELPNPCDWGDVYYEIQEVTYEKGIFCENGHVRKIDLFENNLIGLIPESITKLERLQTLKLGNNHLSDEGNQTIPAFLGELKNLRTLSLPGNQFKGPIPESLQNLTKLWSLSLSNNPDIGGTIPSFFENFQELQTLSMHHNNMDGTLAVLGKLSHLQSLWLSHNNLTGTLEILTQLTQLVEVSVSYNNLTGNLPEKLGNLSHLEYLSAHHNQLEGMIPASMGKLSQLHTLRLNTNRLTGSLPNELGSLSNLLILSLSQNNLSGSIPEFIGNNLTNLQYLSLHSNDFIGSIPVEFGNLSQLQTLWLYRNSLSGAIPTTFGNLSSLRQASLSNNYLSEAIPAEIGNLTNLERISLHKNNLSGSIPAELGNLKNLQVLNLYGNELCGDIPRSFMNLNINPPLPNKKPNLRLTSNGLNTEGYDTEFLAWLNEQSPDWKSGQIPCDNVSNENSKSNNCSIYALHDEQKNDSHLFTIQLNNDNAFEVKALGEPHLGYDLEELAYHPLTKEIYASSGNDVAKGHKSGYLYQVDSETGTVTPHCRIASAEVSAMSFHPMEHSLWIWINRKGLFAVNTDSDRIDENGYCRISAKGFNADAEIEALTWDKEGKKLYGVAEGITTLYHYHYETDTGGIACDNFSPDVEALDMLDTGELLFASNGTPNHLNLFNINSCAITENAPLPLDIPYTDIEGISWICD